MHCRGIAGKGKRMKKRIHKSTRGLAVLLAVVMLAGLTGGCGLADLFHKENSIFTGDPDAIRVFVRYGTDYADRLVEQFPDIPFDFYNYGGLNTSMAINQLLEKDDFGDVCITSLQVKDEIARDHLMDLSGNGICGRYEQSILNQFDVDGSIYQLPSYVTMRSIIYNKDMFEEHGWKEPENFGELTALCRQIREETEQVVPIVMGGAALGYYFTTMTSYAQAEFLYTPEGQQWMKAWQRGESSAEEGFGEGIRMTQELIDAGAFDYDANESLWDMGLFLNRMLTGEAAMMFCWGGQAEVVKTIEENPQIRFGMLPFRNRAGEAFIGTNIPYYYGLAKSLGEKGNEKKLEQAMRVLDWLSTEEGISALSQEGSANIFPLNGAKNENALGITRDFWNTHLDAIKAPMLYAGYEDILLPAAEVIAEAVKGNTRLDGLASYIDEVHEGYLEGGAGAIQIGSFDKDFTHAETVQIIAHMMQSSRKDSDITLVSDGYQKDGVINLGGAFMKFFAGPVLDDQISICVPGRAITLPAMQMELTGQQVKELLENGKHGVMRADSKEPKWVESDPDAIAEASFDYYWAGMDVSWKKGKVTSIKLENGTVLKDDQICTVTFAPGDYTEKTAAMGNPKELPYTFQDIITEYMGVHSPVKPVPVLR